MKKGFIFTIILIIFISLIPNTYAWAGPSNELGTHYQITSFAFDYLFKYIEAASSFKMYKDYSDVINNYSYMPDIIEFGHGTHYYVYYPNSNESYYKNRKGLYQRSARTSFEEYYTLALYYFKETRVKESAMALGMAIHYIEDMCCPVHAAGIHGHTLHHNFEHYFDNRVKEYLNYQETSFDYINSSFEDLCKYLVSSSASKESVSLILNPCPKSWEELGLKYLPFSVTSVVKILERFIKDTKDSVPSFICINNIKYQIKLSDKYMGFNLINGNNALTTGFISVGDKLYQDSFKQAFKVAIVGNKIRISTPKGKYFKSLTNNLKIKAFKPHSEYLFDID